MKLKLGLLNKDLAAVRFDISTSRMSKVFRSLVPLIVPLVSLVPFPIVLKRILKIACAS